MGELARSPDGDEPGSEKWRLPPDGAHNFGDIQDTIFTFENNVSAVSAIYHDNNGDMGTPKRFVNFGDIQMSIFAFEGIAYTDHPQVAYPFCEEGPIDCEADEHCPEGMICGEPSWTGLPVCE